MSETVNVLFVCMGNICRSPAGETIFRQYVNDKKLTERIICDSCGTLNEHAGEKADPRMIRAAKDRGFEIEGRARQFKPDDFSKFDYILAMDRYVQRDLHNWAKSDEDHRKVMLMTDYYLDEDMPDVPDPYYGRREGFDLVLDILERACSRLLDHVIERHDLKP